MPFSQQMNTMREDTGLHCSRPVSVRIGGYAACFGVADQSGDIIEAGAFSKKNFEKLIPGAQSGVKMLYQHKAECPIGLWTDLQSDDYGLKVTGMLSLATPLGRDVHALIQNGILDGLSVGFRTLTAVRDRQGRRRIRHAELWEISIVTFPMARGARLTSIGRPGPEKGHGQTDDKSVCPRRRAPSVPSGARRHSVLADGLTAAAEILKS